MELTQLDVAEAHELVPGSVRGEELPHAGHGEDREAAGAHDLATEMDEARIMTHVGVGEEDAREPGHIGSRCGGVERWSCSRKSGVASMSHRCPVSGSTMPMLAA
jgi:hypothetical protein